MLRRIGWSIMTVTSLVVAAYALALVMLPGVRPPLLRERLASDAMAVYLHLGAAAFAMALGPFQLSNRLRARFTRIHRLSGRFYGAGVFLGGVASLALAMESQRRWLSRDDAPLPGCCHWDRGNGKRYQFQREKMSRRG